MSDGLREALERKLQATDSDGWALSNAHLRALLAAHPAAPAVPWYIARQRHSWEEPNPGQWLCKDCGAEEDDEGNQTVPPLTSYCSPAAPAGDAGGLREALERIVSYEPAQQPLDIDNADCAACKQAEVRQWPPSGLCEDHDHALSKVESANARERAHQHAAMRRIALEALAAAPAVPQPAGKPKPLREALDDWPEPVGTFDEVLERSAQARLSDGAVPQPVDREALAICLHSFDGYAIEAGESWAECTNKGAFFYQADAVLALFSGSEETPGMKLSRLSIEANARNNGSPVLAGEQEQVEK